MKCNAIKRNRKFPYKVRGSIFKHVIISVCKISLASISYGAIKLKYSNL